MREHMEEFITCKENRIISRLQFHLRKCKDSCKEAYKRLKNAVYFLAWKYRESLSSLFVVIFFVKKAACGSLQQ